MNIDPGLAVVIVAVLIFYLRLIILQRQRVKRISQIHVAAEGTKKGRKSPAPAPAPRYSILSQNRRDQVIGLIGMLAVVVGVLLNAKLIPWPMAQPYWWLPTAIGIIAFSWAFKL
jgi:hypothetical protein